VTRTHVTEPVDAPDLESALVVLRASGMRASTARRLVLGTLYAADRPLTADEIAGGLNGKLPQSDPASVYRNLEVLEQIGLVHHVHLGHGPGLYVGAGGAVREYMMCEECGDIKEVKPSDLDEVRKVIKKKFRHEARFTHFPLPGLCAGCAKQIHGKKKTR